MAEIKIPFNNWSLTEIYLENKFCTSRTKRYGMSGDTFRLDMSDVLEGGEIRTYVILDVKKFSLDWVSRHLYSLEGCGPIGQFRNIWAKIHPRKGFVKDQKVWVHFFTELEGTRVLKDE